MPQKLNKAGKMQDYIPKGNGDASGEYGTSNGTNKNFTASDKKSSKANVITENKSVKVIPYKEWIKKEGNKERLEKGIPEFLKRREELKNKANVIDDDLTKIFGENEKYDKSYSNNPKLEEKLKSNIVEKLNEEFKGKSDEYIRQNGFSIAKGIASDEIRKEEFKDLKFGSFGSNMTNFDNMVRASLEQRKIDIKKNDNLTPTNSLKIEKMNEAQLDNEIAKTKREIDRLDGVMKSNTKESELTKQFPLGVGGSGWSADRKKQFVKNIESETKQAKKFTDSYKDKESLKNRLDALNKAKEQVKGTGKTQEQLKQNVINNTQSTINWEKGKIANPYGKGEINVIKANGYEIRSVDNGFYSIYKDGKSVGNTNKLKDAKAYVERIVQKQSKANVIS